MSSTECGLIADIGGTNVRFALTPLTQSAAGTADLVEPRSYRTADFAGIVEAAARYLADVGRKPGFAVFALAGVVRGDEVRITNTPWRFLIPEARRRLELEDIVAVNDFSAVAWAIPALGHDGEQVALGPHEIRQPSPDGIVAALGPGTGLGVSALRMQSGRCTVVSSEAGHVAFAPSTDEEIEVLRCLRQRFGRVSCERVLSGPGLANLYEVLCALEGRDRERATPEQVTRLAASGENPMCVRAVDLFCELLGAFAGDVALMFNAWEGVYLAGGIIPALLGPLRSGGFRARFEDKGRLGAILADVPTNAIVRPDAGLLGAARALRHAVRERETRSGTDSRVTTAASRA